MHEVLVFVGFGLLDPVGVGGFLDVVHADQFNGNGISLFIGESSKRALFAKQHIEFHNRALAGDDFNHAVFADFV